MSPDGSRSAPLPGPLGRLAGAIYAREIRRRNRAYDRGGRVTRLDRPVISVGNLSAGGTGKTPMVMKLATALLEAGHHPCIAMRGYKAAAGRSDEAEEYRARLVNVPVVAQPDRISGLRALFATEVGRDVDVVLLDDGFQHRRLARDLDIVLVDATRSPFEDRLLPAGYLREPPASLERAQAVVITHAEAVVGGEVDRLEGRLRAVASSLAISVARHRWAEILDDADRPVSRLEGGRVLVVCAIGNPAPFVTEARARFGMVGEPVELGDHDPYPPATVDRIVKAAAGADAILVTSKDWAKLKHVDPRRWPCPLWRPRLELAFDRGWDELLGLALRAASGVPGPVAFDP